jgi:hypothetical protein
VNSVYNRIIWWIIGSRIHPQVGDSSEDIMKKIILLIIVLAFVLAGCATTTPEVKKETVIVQETSIVKETVVVTEVVQVVVTATEAPPTKTPTPTATSTPPTIMDPIVLTGSGDDVVKIDKLQKPQAVLHIVGNEDDRYFSVTAYYEDESSDLLVNTGDPFDGLVPIGLYGSYLTMFEVKANGDWQIEINDLNTLPEYPASKKITGVGSTMFRIQPDNDVLKIIGNEDDRYFSVDVYQTGGGSELLVNTGDPYEGKVRFPQDAYLMVIEATGEWTINPESEPAQQPTVMTQENAIEGIARREEITSYFESLDYTCTQPNDVNNVSCENKLGEIESGYFNSTAVIIKDPVEAIAFMGVMYTAKAVPAKNGRSLLLNLAELINEQEAATEIKQWITEAFPSPLAETYEFNGVKEIDGVLYELLVFGDVPMANLIIRYPE